MQESKSITFIVIFLSMFIGLSGCSEETKPEETKEPVEIASPVKISIQINANRSEIIVGEAEQILITLNKENEKDTKKVVCFSTDGEIASIIENHVKGLAVGETTIVCSLGDIKSAPITMTVKAEEALVVETPDPVQILKIVSYTKSVSAGSKASITILGIAGKSYNISVVYNSGESTAAGLGDKVANSKGIITWIWKVGARTAPGNYSIEVYGEDETVEAVFTVK